MVSDAMSSPALSYDTARYGDMTWKPDELRHALVFSYYAGGVLALNISACFAVAAADPKSCKSFAVMGTALCAGMVGAAVAVDGDAGMAVSTKPPVAVWTVLGGVGAAAILVGGGAKAKGA